MIRKLVSICIPTYNGEKAIAQTLDSLIKNVNSAKISAEIEIVLTDDCSSDNTFSILEKYANEHEYIKIFKNEKNLGMDGNFRQAALNSSGKFVWFSGQDDIFLAGSISHILDVITGNESLGIIYVNYSQYDEDLARNICDSMFHEQVYNSKEIDFNHNLFFKNGAEYFKFFTDAPTFLPATVMRRQYWLNTNTDEFVGTHYIQYANILINMKDCQIAAVTRPYIQGLIPSNGWQKNGNFLFSVILGNMKAQTLIFRNYLGALPKRVYFKKKRHFIGHFFPLVLAAKLNGHKISRQNKENLKYVFGLSFYYLYFLPILYLSLIFPNRVIKILKRLKNARKDI